MRARRSKKDQNDPQCITPAATGQQNLFDIPGVGGRAVKSHGVKTMARTSRPTVSLTARRAIVATRQSARLGRIARGAGRKARKMK